MNCSRYVTCTANHSPRNVKLNISPHHMLPEPGFQQRLENPQNENTIDLTRRNGMLGHVMDVEKPGPCGRTWLVCLSESFNGDR